MPIAHRTAARTASRWHGGGGSALYALSSTGAIDTAYHRHSCREEITECLDIADPMQAYELDQLRHYVAHHGPRPAIPNWHRIVK